MTDFDVEAWTDFGVAVAGCAAALVGLLFVAVSLNLREIVAVPGLASRAATNLAQLIAILLVALYLLTPHQADWVVGAEITATGLPVLVAAVRVGWHRHPGRRLSHSLASLLLVVGTPVLLIAGGASLLAGAGGGLYWVTAAVAAGFATSAFNAWVLLVEVQKKATP